MTLRPGRPADAVAEALLAHGGHDAAAHLHGERISPAMRRRIAEQPDPALRDACADFVRPSVDRGVRTGIDALEEAYGRARAELVRAPDPKLRAAVARAWCDPPLAVQAGLLTDPDPRSARPPPSANALLCQPSWRTAAWPTPPYALMWPAMSRSPPPGPRTSNTPVSRPRAAGHRSAPVRRGARFLSRRFVTCQDGDMNLEHVFVCGNPVLDFAATLRARRTLRFEMFAAPDRLDAWFLESGVVDVVTPSDEADLERAKALREAVYRLVTARRLGEAYDTGALDLLNRTARMPAAVPQLTSEGRRTEAMPQEALAALARQAVELLSGPDVPLLKECGNPECTRVYIDRSRGMRRQWCGMESCGNRIKAAAYRARKRSAPALGVG